MEGIEALTFRAYGTGSVNGDEAQSANDTSLYRIFARDARTAGNANRLARWIVTLVASARRPSHFVRRLAVGKPAADESMGWVGSLGVAASVMIHRASRVALKRGKGPFRFV